ncbi:type II toxin-antitoxin system Phd/YefM family antitoxin [Streptomyces mobaraensis]|uniref:Type II toxin-antitoxin system Phd/YefM family antitoxin n=1 Tax=Streptomyces mobaraensis TaxID=35621 RepID=A0A5N5VXD5_STRMB|nr:type II toxin-antitoxin system Phd/YefM family antitoxin [Streptomyces mobaraensis]KAB7833533.1 type II toxin-antitoxin system Phd/YefM family antitoxin [Streptomyces mobaraensis]
MAEVEYDSPIRKVRDQIAAVVDRAKDDGAITYVTRQGERVAAVVPLPVAERGARPPAQAPVDSQGRLLRPAPSAAGGRFAGDGLEPSREEVEWNRAGLEALHAHLVTLVTEGSALLGVTGQALAATSDRHLGTVYELLGSLDDRLAAPEAALADARDLVDELARPDDALCVACRQPINHFYGHEGWQHHREAVNEYGINATEIYEPEDGHAPQPTFVPRTRLPIADGRVVRPPLHHRTSDQEEE